MKNRIKLYLIIGFLIGTVDCLATWFFRFTDGDRSKWSDEKAHDIWLMAISAVQIISGVLLWPIKIVGTVCIIVKDIIIGKSILDDVGKDIIEEY